MKPADFLRRLRRLATERGWTVEVVEGGRHTKVRPNGRKTVVPRHSVDLKTGTYRSILRDLEPTPADPEGWTPMRYAYPVTLEPQPEGGFTATFEGLPGATEGETEAEALRGAEDLLVTALSFYTDDGEPLPRPVPAQGRPMVEVPSLVAAKLALHDAMLAAGVNNVELATRLGLDEKAVRRLRDPLHRSHIGAVEAALRALGRRLLVEVVAVA